MRKNGAVMRVSVKNSLYIIGYFQAYRWA